jgi:hypothetical protein
MSAIDSGTPTEPATALNAPSRYTENACSFSPVNGVGKNAGNTVFPFINRVRVKRLLLTSVVDGGNFRIVVFVEIVGVDPVDASIL